MTDNHRDPNQANEDAVPRRRFLQQFSTAVCGVGYTATHAADPESGFRRATTQNSDSEKQTVFVSAVSRAIKGKEKILERELLSLSSKVRSEPGCVFYDLYRSIEQPNLFMRFEEWSSQEALDKHRQMPYLAESSERRKMLDMLSEPTLITGWKKIG